MPNRDNRKLAIGAILAACLALSLGDALIKQSSASFVIWQIFVVRSAIAIPFLLYFARLQGCAMPIRPRHTGWTMLRSLILVLMWILYFAALPRMQLATAAAAYYTLPIFIMLLAALFLGEAMTVRGWLAAALGFGGVLLILQPETGDFDILALLPVAAAICYACAMLLTRAKCREENAAVLSLWLNCCFLASGALALLALWLWQPSPDMVAINPFLLGAWIPMWLDEWRAMGILAAAIVVGSIGAALAYQNAPASVIAIFDYSYLVFALVWGNLLFDELPTLAAAGGMVLIVTAGIIVTRPQSQTN